MDSLKSFLISKFGEEGVLINQPMSTYTSFRTGGNADFIIAPDNSKINELKEFLQYAKDNNINIVFMGNGSNTLVTDKGIRGVVILLRNLNHVIFDDEIIKVEAGMNLGKLSKIFADNSYTGLEFACGIPGTVGGAIFMNAGAYVTGTQLMKLGEYYAKAIHENFGDDCKLMLSLFFNLKIRTPRIKIDVDLQDAVEACQVEDN